VAARPGAWPAEPVTGTPSVETPVRIAGQADLGQADLDRSDLGKTDWWGAEQRRLGRSGPPLDLAERPDERPSVGASEALWTGTSAPSQRSALTGSSAAGRRRGWLLATRSWAVLKVASMAYTTWWAMGYVHAGVGTTVSAYGAVCLFAGFGARWRKRFFGPGQIIEPEVYEEVGRWLYRVGVVLVIVGGAAVTARYLSH
jgi:hypothetical protein